LQMEENSKGKGKLGNDKKETSTSKKEKGRTPTTLWKKGVAEGRKPPTRSRFQKRNKGG